MGAAHRLRNEAVESVARRARAAGHEVVEADPPFGFDEAYDLWGLLVGYEMRPALPLALRNRLAVRAFAAWFLVYRLGDGPLSASIRCGLLASGADYRDGLARRDGLIARTDRSLADHPLWVLPTSPMPAIPRQRSGRPIRFEGAAVPYSRFLESSDYESAVRLAVSLGGDCDTLACIAGGIAAAFYGVPGSIRDHALARLDEPLSEVVAEFERRYPEAARQA